MAKTGKTDGFRWANAPPPRKRVVAKIRRVKPGELLRAVLLDSQVHGIWTHYISQRTKPCLGKRCPCHDKDSELRMFWKGYAMAWSHNDQALVILEFTPEAIHSDKYLSAGCDCLRGALVELRRTGQHTNAPVAAKVVLGHAPETRPSSLELIEALARVWFGTRRKEQQIAQQWFDSMRKHAAGEELVEDDQAEDDQADDEG